MEEIGLNIKAQKCVTVKPFSVEMNQIIRVASSTENLIATSYTRYACKAVIQPTYSTSYHEVPFPPHKIQVHFMK